MPIRLRARRYSFKLRLVRDVLRRGALALAFLTSLSGCSGGEEINPAPPDGASPDASTKVDATSGSDGSAADGNVPPVSPSDAAAVGDVSRAPDSDVVCTPKTCADYPAGTCGQQSDGCGALTAPCGANDAGGPCPPGQTCGGGGPNRCGAGSARACAGYGCQPHDCYQEGLECGLGGDGCGGVLDCGPCPGSGTCSTGNTCVWPADAGACVPATCGSLGYPCGTVTDGCGKWLDCGACPAPQYCGGGGFRQCGGRCEVPDAGDGCLVQCSSDAGTCSGLSCVASGSCGVVTNACGGLMDCGRCGGDAGPDDAGMD